ncbi:conjugative transposon protein TraN [Pedobacter sp. P26]|uniref:conjugative transposon protein TraN n=1 Tax=Pedobacter sp. P26 TaxID=3423956 RepID=UPI003D671CF8
MKKIILAVQFLLCSMTLFAQKTGTLTVSEIPVIGISGSVSLHFISPEKISYVDLSSPSLIGDLPEKNILRVKAAPDSIPALLSSGEAGLVTIVGETFISQFRLCFLPSQKSEYVSSQVEILPQYMRPLDISGASLSTPELKANALSILKLRRKEHVNRTTGYGIFMTLNRVFTLGDCVLLDLSFKNATNLIFDVDELRFKLEDRKVNKSTNVQSIELKPVFSLYPFEQFKSSFRNIYILKKATFPGNKVFNIELSEKQVSGRNLKLSIHYSDILNADTI